MTDTPESRLQSLGITLPEAPAAVANYVPFLRLGNLLFISGQLPLKGGKITCTGKLGADVSLEDGVAAARLCALNGIAQMAAAVGGNLSAVKHIVKITGFVNSTPDYGDQPQVINGASDLLVEVFGEAGRHTRSAVSAGALPRGAAVEVEFIVAL